MNCCINNICKGELLRAEVATGSKRGKMLESLMKQVLDTTNLLIGFVSSQILLGKDCSFGNHYRVNEKENG